MTERVTDRSEPDVWSGLTADVLEPANEPARCTIYPHDVDAGLALTTWIQARGDAFVSLSEMR